MKKILIPFIVAILCTLSATDQVNAQDYLLKRANSLYEQFHFVSAIELYQKVLEKDKKNAEAWENLAHCYRLTSNSKKAGYAYKKAIRYNEKKHVLKFYCGQALMSNEEYLDALKWFEKYTELVPHDSRGWHFVESCQNIEANKAKTSDYTIENLNQVNSSESDFGAAFFKNGIVFASGRTTSVLDRKSDWTGEAFVDIYYTMPLTSSGEWSTPQKLEGKKNIPAHEGPACFNQYNTMMYFTRNTGKKSKKTGIVNLKIYEAKWINGKWDEVKSLSFNSDDYSVGHPALSNDGKKIYFTSDMPGGFGGKDIYMSELKNGRWGKPKNLGKGFNSEGDEMFPSVHVDGTLYYASDGLGGFGGLDIFVAENDNGAWEVSNAGFLINTAKDDFGLIFDEQKNIGYFASNRKGGNGSDDLYIISTKSNQQVVNVQAVNAQKQVAQAKPVSYNGANKATPTLIDERYSAPQQHNSVADNTPISPKLTYNSAPQLLLIGIVLDKVTKQPIGGLNVELEDMVTKERQAFQLQNDGNFYFQLESEKRYELMVVNDKGIIGESKYISTINKVGPQVMHTILEGNAYDVTKKSTKVKATSMATDFKTYEQPELATFETYEQPKTDTGNTYHEDSFIDNNSDLVFKIQVGAFKSPLDVDNNFFNEISGEINPERAPSGLTRYVTGNFSNYDSADKYRKELIRRGINTAFVAAYLNGHRMELPVDEVIDMYSEHK